MSFRCLLVGCELGVLAGLRLVVCVGLGLPGIVQFRGISFCSRGVNIIGFVDCWLLGFELMVFLCVSGGWGWWLMVDVGFGVLGLWCCLLGFEFMVACV